MFEAGYIEATRYIDGLFTYKRPLYVVVGLGWDCDEALLRRLGYRFVKSKPTARRYYYARPWPVWAALRGRGVMRQAYWGVLLWLYQRGLFHFRTPEAQCKRWRDIGLGPKPGEKHA